jgi:CRP-like cAMP-binding protein
MKTIKYDHSKNQKNITGFMQELPYKVRIDLAMEIHKNIYSTIDFFKVKEKSFIAWIGPLLKPLNVQELEYIFKEGEDLKEIFFLVNGVAGYVLPRFDNTVYIKIERGDHFGHVDLVLDQEIIAAQINIKGRIERNMTRKFTVQALIDCELLMLLIEDIDKMKIEFPDVFDELFMNSYRRLKKELEIKIKAIQLCEEATKSNNT